MGLKDSSFKSLAAAAAIAANSELASVLSKGELDNLESAKGHVLDLDDWATALKQMQDPSGGNLPISNRPTAVLVGNSNGVLMSTTAVNDDRPPDSPPPPPPPPPGGATHEPPHDSQPTPLGDAAPARNDSHTARVGVDRADVGGVMVGNGDGVLGGATEGARSTLMPSNPTVAESDQKAALSMTEAAAKTDANPAAVGRDQPDAGSVLVGNGGHRSEEKPSKDTLTSANSSVEESSQKGTAKTEETTSTADADSSKSAPNSSGSTSEQSTGSSVARESNQSQSSGESGGGSGSGCC